MSRPDRSIGACPACQRDDGQGPPVLNPDGNLDFTCTYDHGGRGPVVFTRITPDDTGRSSGMTAVRDPDTKTDDLLEHLRGCIRAQDGWTEFGVIERRLQDLAPEVFARHVAEAGHRMFGPKSTTASGARVSTALSRLEAQGLLAHDERLSTGAAWKHSRAVSYWLLLPDGDGSRTLTWVQYCIDMARSDGWTDADRAGLSNPLQAI